MFLLRPPQLTDDFGDFIARAGRGGWRHIVFLSVQGAENNRFIPHHKTEQLLICSGLAYTLLRPAYFMQNFTTTLRADLVERHRIFLPAGRARFTLIDVDDISRVGGTSAKPKPSRPSTGSRFSRWPTSSPPAWVGKSPISRPVPGSFSGSKSARDWPRASS